MVPIFLIYFKVIKPNLNSFFCKQNHMGNANGEKSFACEHN